MNFLRKTVIILCISALSALFGSRAEAQVCALKTNALMLAGLTPNFGVEIVTGEHTSFEFSAFGHKDPYGLTSRIVGLQPEFRYWFNGRPMIREYVGIGALLASYDMTFRQHIIGKKAKESPYQVNDGDVAGLGLTGGYVFALGKRFNMELSGSFGVMYFRQKQYFPADKYDTDKIGETMAVNARGIKFIPVDFGVTFTYILK